MNIRTSKFAFGMLFYQSRVMVVLVLFFLAEGNALAQKKDKSIVEHPCLILQKKDVADLKTAIQTLEIVRNSYNEQLTRANIAVHADVIVPIPVDPAGAYTHEKHRNNYLDMYAAGICYQVTGDTIYSNFITKMLLKYAVMYPTLGTHPEGKNSAPGKLFWQNLNETVWLVYTIQAYDCAYDAISVKDRKVIEKGILREMVKFISVDNREVFDKIHNHGTWAAAAVGMTGYVIGDNEMVKKAIYGTKGTQESGFLRQIHDLISPDGYYAEGPYYLRYALMPFMLFAQAIQNNQAEVKIFEYKDRVFQKAVLGELQLTDEKGLIFPVNDAMREKGIQTAELVAACNIAYNQYGDKNILPIVREQGQVILGGPGIRAAQGLAQNPDVVFEQYPLFARDGIEGKNGGIAVSRIPFKSGKLTTILKFTTQGMGHGHFDRLSLMAYDAAGAFLSDYGAARFLNIPTKYGGRYLPENDSWAQQSIAHNTVIVDETSHCRGNWRESEKASPALLYNIFDKDIQIIAAKDSSAYPDVVMKRIVSVIPEGDAPFIIDLFSLESNKAHNYDYAFQYQGHVIATTFDFKPFTTELKSLGKKDGYDHLWLEAKGKTQKPTATFTWWKEEQFYSITTIADTTTQFLLTRAGANDPNFNIRHQPSFIVRQPESKSHFFVSVIEPHGDFNPVSELVESPQSCVSKLQLVYSDTDVAIVDCAFKNGNQYRLCLALNNDPNKEHLVTIGVEQVNWKGNYKLSKK